MHVRISRSASTNVRSAPAISALISISPLRSWLRRSSPAWATASSLVKPKKPQVPLIVWTARNTPATFFRSEGLRSSATRSPSTWFRLSWLSTMNSLTMLSSMAPLAVDPRQPVPNQVARGALRREGEVAADRGGGQRGPAFGRLALPCPITRRGQLQPAEGFLPRPAKQRDRPLPIAGRRVVAGSRGLRVRGRLAALRGADLRERGRRKPRERVPGGLCGARRRGRQESIRRLRLRLEVVRRGRLGIVGKLCL